MLLETMVQVHVSALTAAQTNLRKKPGIRRTPTVKACLAAHNPKTSKIPSRRHATKSTDDNPALPAEWEKARADLLRRIPDKNAAAHGRQILLALEPHITRAWTGSHANQELAGRLSEFKDLLDALNVGVVVIDAAGAVGYINEPARQLLNLPAATMVGKQLPPPLNSWAQDAIVAAATNHTPVKASLDINGLKLMVEVRELAPDRFVLRLERSRIHVEIESLMGYGLSQRQAEVLALILRGASNREIAAALFLSRRTIEKHVETILDVLGVATRSAAIAEVIARRETGH